MAAVPHILPQEAQPQAQKPRWLTQEWLEPRFVGVTLVALLLSTLGENLLWPASVILALNVLSYATGGVFGAKNALLSLRERKIDVDMLMILAALGAASINQWHEGAILLFLFSLSNVLQDYAIGRSRQAIRSLFKLYPQQARVRRNGTIATLHVNEIGIGEVVLIEPGERIPVDGIVRAGRSAVDQAPITGESMPVEKNSGDKVFAGALNGQGTLDVEATAAATDTTLARIIKMVEEAQDSKAPTERLMEKFEQYYAALIILGTLLFIFVPPALGLTDFQSNFYRAMVLMTVASPCALVISTPASFISAIASAARGGVLFKGGAFIEQLARIKAIAFDKTGTLTKGKPAVTDVVSCCEISDDELLRVVASVESRSEHPLAKAIVDKAQARGLKLEEVEDFQSLPGMGVRARVENELVQIGSPRFMASDELVPHRLSEARAQFEAEGKTVILARRENAFSCPPERNCEDCQFSGRGGWMGLVAIADGLRPEAREAVAALKGMGIQVAMLTGDHLAVGKNIAAQVGVDHVHADLLPEDKVDVIKHLQRDFGAVAMVGDGVNDAPGLATADIGIAMGAAGTDVALETADVVLMGDKLELIAYAIALSKKARRVVWQNIAFSLAVIALLIFSAFAINLPLPLGVFGHEGSTVIVVLNGLITLLIIPEIQRRRSAAI
ncbi:MAG: cadmium-translocating P-type ATPase [Chloroflexi bacterium]|nr:cadmium-translocating P-type ATPase [Chloroflexota bacterium]